MKENLTKLQNRLDQEKYFESEKNQHDMSGEMSYCAGCKYRVMFLNHNQCAVSHYARATESLCAQNHQLYFTKKEKKKKCK